ncbi:hypothetical protein KKH23_08195 [Patescibacteria group bacterium]|nr:hypothetical protein [Patescibacteria group bacterium]
MMQLSSEEGNVGGSRKQKCVVCGAEIQGIEVYGPTVAVRCWSCYAKGNEGEHVYYGMAPHHHDESITGSVVGSTVIESAEPTDEFTPDPDAPGLGVWHVKVARGWR